MEEHIKRMKQLIEFTKQNSDVIPYSSSIYDENDKMLVCVVADETVNPIGHAETTAISECARKYPNIKWNTLSLYSTGEPCCMCAAAVCWANLREVIYATDVPYMIQLWGIESPLRASEIIKTYPKPPTLIPHICKEEADQMFFEFKDKFANFWNEKRWDLTNPDHAA